MKDSLRAQAAEAPQGCSNHSILVSRSGFSTRPVDWPWSRFCSSSKTAVLHTAGTPQRSAYRALTQNKLSWI